MRSWSLPVAPDRAGIGELAQVDRHRFAVRRGVVRKAIPEILQREIEPLLEPDCVLDGLGQIAEQLRHGGGGFDMAFGIPREPAARGIKGRVQPEAGEYIRGRAL